MEKRKNIFDSRGFELFLQRLLILFFSVMTAAAYTSGYTYWAIVLGAFVLLAIADYVDLLNKWRHVDEKTMSK
ncbi:MAG TPA: hypothetical protein PKW49_00925 [Paludibacteraceae bacterium]|nr:hypothetical protein [Paludibacteraceae bacterium]